MAMLYSNMSVYMPSKSIYNPNYSILIASIQEARVVAGLSQKDLAKMLGVSQSTWSKIENGERRIDLIELRQFCKCVKVDFLDFIKSVDKKMS